MADHSKPTTTSTYVNFVSELDGRLDDISVGLDPAVTTATNLATNSIRWTSASNKWQKYNGTTWNDLSSAYSININGTVGATTPASGAFTTLSATGNVTLGDASGDTVTINGTVGAGVVISGSTATDALRITQTGAGNALVVEDSTNPDSTPFVVDASGNVGIGISSPNAKLDVLTTASTRLLVTERSTGGNVIDSVNGSNTAYAQFLLNGSSLIFATGATERMRIDSSGNVGIGTNSPSALLHVSNVSAKIRIGVDGSSQYTDIYRDSATGYTVYNAAQSATFRGHIWQLGGSEAMRIDSSGYVLMGLTSGNTGNNILTAARGITAQDSSGPALQLYNTGAGTNQKFFRIFSDTSGNTDFQRVNDAYSAVTTNFMRIDSSGNVGIGTSSPSTKLHVVGEVTATQGVGGYPAFHATAGGAQTVTTGTNTKVTLTEDFDTNSNFASSRFTPTVAGYYQINAVCYVTASTSMNYAGPVIYKNGVVGSLCYGTNFSSTSAAGGVADIIYLNGSTDYVELYVRASGTGTLTVATNTFFSACLIRGA